jgi:DNA-binding beta-propeller fold protein YncE
MMRVRKRIGIYLLAAAVLGTTCVGEAVAKKKKKKDQLAQDPYADIVWPPPPDQPRIKLETVITGRGDVELTSKFRKKLLRASSKSPYDWLQKPFAVAYDAEGRILVTDTESAALLRFDRVGKRMDVFGTRSSVELKLPMGLDVGPDGTIYVADVGLQQVVAFDPAGAVVRVYGGSGELSNPTDVVVSPDGSRLFVTDSKAHKVVVFDVASTSFATSFGRRGEGEGEFSWPTSLTFGPEGDLFVVDQINCRVQVFGADGEYEDEFGRLGTRFGEFIRPKDIAVDEMGFVYVTDNAFNNVQLFDADFSLLTFIGSGGARPGQFNGASGIAVHGDEFAVVDQLGRRLQVFRFVVPKDQ